MNNLLIQTENGNNYLYIIDRKEFLVIAPILYEILDCYFKNGDIEELKITLNSKFDQNDVNYYYNYFTFLRKNKYLTSSQQMFVDKYNGSDLEFNIANINQIIFETTQSCNLNCKYCGFGNLYNKNTERNNTKMQFAIAKTFIDYIIDKLNSNNNSSYQKPLCLSFYGGEPLLNFDLIKEIVEYISKKKLHSNFITYSLTTNATFLFKYIDFLHDNNFSILVSLDGNRENDSYRTFYNHKPSFDLVMNNLQRVRDKYPKYFSKIRYNSVLHNKNSVDEIHTFFQNHFSVLPQISELNCSNLNDELTAEFNSKFKSMLQDTRQSQNYTTLNKDFFIGLPEVRSIADLLFSNSSIVYKDYSELVNGKNKHIPTATCSPFSRRLFLTVEGNILPCEKVSHNFVLGKVTARGVDINFKNVAQMYNNYLQSIHKRQCYNCYKNTTCNQCIFMMKESNGMFSCYAHNNNTQQVKDLSKRLSYFETNREYFDEIINTVNIV